MRDLGLPVFDDHGSPSTAPVEGPKCVEAGRESASSKKGVVTVQKFQLGPTLPVVPARIMRRVLRGNYVDMVKLSEDNLELELSRLTEDEEGKPTPPSKLKPVADPLTSVRSFCIYPDKAQDLLSYLATLLAGAEKGNWWRAYDSLFQQQIPALESAEFGKLDQVLFTLLLVLLAVVSMEALLIRQREGVYHQRRGTGWHHVSPGMMESLVLPLLIDSRTCVPSVVGISASLHALPRWTAA